jgi:hypothetical protein
MAIARKSTQIAGIMNSARLPRLLMLAGLILLAGASGADAQFDPPEQYQLEAQFLVNFTKFVDWPDQTFANSQAHFVLCIVGHDPFGSALDNHLLRHTINNRVAEITRYPTAATLPRNPSCQIAFVSASERPHFQEIIESFDGRSTLLVADTDGFLELGGTIEMLPKEEHVRFVINPESADRANLKLSSKLLALARIVHDDATKGKN